ncbi:glycosyltransferase [Aestuariivita boseongensis]|uniref:glycosyltransferase n=1 Tax=Aestuariivita boseongensis TaxID=1470562 RepID=UPI00155D9A5C|nr:glycosyltransferase [Aestuariivita boseongensis]
MSVFCDPKRRRQKRVRRAFHAVLVLLIVWCATFFLSVKPANKSQAQPSSVGFIGTALKKGVGEEPGNRLENAAVNTAVNCAQRQPPVFAAMASTPVHKRIFAHVPISLEWAHLSISRSCDVIDVLVPDWITLSERLDGISLDVASADTRSPVLEEIAAKRRVVEVMPRLQVQTLPIASDFSGKMGAPETMEVILRQMLETLSSMRAQGACLDVSQFRDTAVSQNVGFLQLFRSALDSRQMRSCIILSSSEVFQLGQDQLQNFDHVIVKAFYEPWVGSAPVPLAGDAWFSDVVDRVLDVVDPSRLVFALGNFATKWETGVPLPSQLPFGEAMATILEYEAEFSFNSETSGGYAAFSTADGTRQKLWMLDAASLHNQLLKLEARNVQNIGVWSLGFEDPGIWPLLAAEERVKALSSPHLTSVPVNDFVRYSGRGPALRVIESPQVGFRKFDVDSGTGQVISQEYTQYPRPYLIERYGRLAPNELVLTFDDGPHAEYTSRVLDVLRDTQTPAVFFALGQSVMAEPEVLKRALSEGHEIGAHSFSHPRMDLISQARTAFEHDLTDRIIASSIGHHTILYREPFLRSGGPTSASRVPPLEYVQARGSIIFGMDIVPKDWTGISAAQIANYVIEEVIAGNGNVILLHDGGDRREASVEALPVIIETLKSLGYEFTTASKVLGLSQSTLMPEAKGYLQTFDRLSFTFASGTLSLVSIVFWTVLLIGVGRAAIILCLATVRRRHKILSSMENPKVAVIIPAFEEQESVANCIESVLASTYRNIEIVVVNDGSMDNTLNEVLKFKHRQNVRVILQPNQGKWAALNRALSTLDAEIAVCIDADTQVERDAIGKLAEHFANPKIGAVAGKVMVGNRVNLLTRMQALEYITSQNFERRAFDAINGILVVPGALGAWRVSALRRVGFFSDETMTEDADVTMAISRAGYRIVYDERAIAQTEVPDSVRGLMAQRLRWSLGMFQAAWKHKRALREGRSVGCISIPDMFVFGYLFPLLAPIVDILVLVLLYQYLQGEWIGDVGSAQTLLSPSLIWAYLALPLAELMISLFAVISDRRANCSLLWVWPLQRLFYRPILYFTVYRALLRAISGSLAAWGRSKRKGNDFLLLEKTV